MRIWRGTVLLIETAEGTDWFGRDQLIKGAKFLGKRSSVDGLHDVLS